MQPQKFTTEKQFSGYLRVNACGRQFLGDRDYNTLREKGRVDYYLHYVSKGTGWIEYEGKNRAVPEGSLVLFFPGVRQHYFFKKEDNADLFWSHFSGTACEMLESLRSEAPVVLEVNDRKQWESAFEKMIHARYCRIREGDALCDAYMSVLLALILQSRQQAEGATPVLGNQRLEKVLSRMHVQFKNPIRIGEYAQMCHVTEDQFIRMFKAYTGLPPYRYQLRLRIQRAVEMLENTSVSVTQCAEIVGFNDVAYFSRIFKKFTGNPPSYYKQS